MKIEMAEQSFEVTYTCLQSMEMLELKIYTKLTDQEGRCRQDNVRIHGLS